MVSLALLDRKGMPRAHQDGQWEGHPEIGNLCCLSSSQDDLFRRRGSDSRQRLFIPGRTGRGNTGLSGKCSFKYRSSMDINIHNAFGTDSSFQVRSRIISGLG